MVTFNKINEKKAKQKIEKVMSIVNLMTSNQKISEKIIIETLFNFLTVIIYNNKYNNDFELFATMSNSQKGETVKIIEFSDITFNKIFNYANNKLTKSSLEQLFEITTSFFKVKGISNQQYINLIDSENNIFRNSIEKAIENCKSEIMEDFIETRFKYIYKIIHNYDEIVLNNNNFNQDKNILYRLLRLYLSYKVTINLYQMRILQIYTFVKDKYLLSQDIELKKIFIEYILDINSKYLVEELSTNEEYLDECKHLFEDHIYIYLESKLSEKDSADGIKTFSFGQGELNKSIIENNTLKTYMHFTIPFKVKNLNNGSIELNDGIVLYFKELTNKFEDPIFRCYKDINVMGKGLNYYSDAFVNDDQISTTIDILLPYFYNPDLIINDDGYSFKDFKKESAKIGRDYYPHKEYIIEILIDNFDLIKDYIYFNFEDININIFSNYIIEYLINFNLQYRKLYTLTNPDSSEKSSKKFLEQIQKLKLSDPYLTIKEMVDNLNFESDYKFRNSICTIFNISVKDIIELSGGYKYFWNKEDQKLIPNTEPHMQPYIYSLLSFGCSYLGIQICKEPEIANGKLDFLLSYNNSNKLVKTCVEVKNAHGNIEHGIQKQLPQYMKSEKTKNGIYLVLWYKGKNCTKPTKYQSKEELKESLKKEIPNGLNIEIIIIDCTKPIVPSKLK